MKHLFIAITAMLLLACGGGGGGSAAQEQAFSPVGVWAGTVGPGTSGTRFDAVVFPDGSFRYAANNYAMASGTFIISGSTAVGNGTLAYNPGTNLGPSPVHIVVSGASKQSMTGTYTAQMSSSWTDSGPINFTYVHSANLPMQLADLAGSYSDDGANIASHGAVALTIGASGAVTGSYAGGAGTYSGTISQPSPGVNAFKVNLVFDIPQSGTMNPYNLIGAAFFDAGTKRLYIQASDPRSPAPAYAFFIGSVLKS